jgi:Cof subfamily protein (haloacid dehalogenase superfamily)
VNIKLLVLDIDGTIAGKSNQVNSKVIRAIQAVKNRGIKVTIATGRMYRSALRFYEAIQGDLPLIAYNGAWIQCPSSKQLHSHLPLNCEVGIQLLDYIQTWKYGKKLEIHCYFNDQLYVERITEKTKIYSQRSGIKPNLINDLRTVIKQNSTKILTICYQPKIMAQLKEELAQYFDFQHLYVTQSSEIYLEATNPLVNKGAAVGYLTEKILGLKPENVMAIGDNFNDLEMLKYAGLSVAMDDAPAEVKNIAQWVAPSVEDDGVAIALEKFLL